MAPHGAWILVPGGANAKKILNELLCKTSLPRAIAVVIQTSPTAIPGLKAAANLGRRFQTRNGGRRGLDHKNSNHKRRRTLGWAKPHRWRQTRVFTCL